MKTSAKPSVETNECGRPKILRPRTVAPDKYVPLKFNGGPIIATPELVTLYWGPFSNAEVA